MKKLLTYCLMIMLMLGMIGCASENDSDETLASTEPESAYIAAEPAADTVPENVTSTTAAQETDTPTIVALEYSGELFLSVSEITFSLQGESEDIYCGTIPRELVTWKSEDESVATFQDGIVTAVGVGSTVVYAEYEDQKMECPVSCLAQTQEELNALSSDILHSPKKIPPVSDGQPCTFFDDAAFVGDSISYSLFQWAGITGELGDALFLVRGGMSINGFVYNYKTIGYQGVEMRLEEAIAKSGVKKIFIMMGTNDIGYNTIERTMENWQILMDRIWELSPELEVYIESCLPLWEAGATGVTNALIDQYNEQLKLFAEENNCHYVEVASYIKDHTNGMAEMYCTDFDTHMNYDGTDIWMQALKTYGQQQINKENE